MKHVKVNVVGAGITGMFVSYYLRKSGHEVSLIEKTTPIAYTSMYNAGLITPTFTSNFPVSLWFLASTMFSPRGPVYISMAQVLRHTRWFRIAMGRGLTGFEEKVRQFATKSLSMYKDFFKEEAIEVDRLNALMGLYRDAEFAKKAAREFNARLAEEREVAELGFKNFGGGIVVENELSINSHKLFRGLRSRLNEMGINLKTGNEVKLLRDGKRVVSAAIDGTRVDADACVVTAGANCRDLLQPMGFDPMIQPAIGRVLMFDTGGATIAGRPALMEDAGISVVQHNPTTFRATSFFELQGFNNKFPDGRKNWMLKTMKEHVTNFEKLKLVEEGVGFRPCSPDQLPIVGLVPGYENLYIGSGNCRLGVTLAPASAYVIQSLVEGGEPSDVPWRSFDPARFSK